MVEASKNDNAGQLSKNAQIAATRKKTRERRKSMQCKTVELKINSSTLSSSQEHCLNMVFLEAKWIYNAALATERPASYIPMKTVPVKTRTGEIEERELRFIGSQLKQSVVNSISESLSSLAARKKKGYKVGKLKFSREINAIRLKQYGATYRVDIEKGRIHI